MALKLVNVYWQEDRYCQLLNILERLYQADPNDWSVILQLQAIYAAWPSGQERAQGLAEELAGLASDEPGRWRELAAHYLYQGDYARAEGAAYRALWLVPTDVHTCCLLEEMAFKQEEYEQAASWCQRAIVLEPDEVTNYCHLATIYGRLEQVQAAQEILAQGVQRALGTGQTVQAADLLHQQASLFVQQQDWDTARSTLGLALGLMPDHLPSLQALLGLYQATEAWAAAIQVISDHLMPHPLVEASYSHDLLGLLYLQAGQAEQAVELFRGLVQLDEAAVEPRYHLALAYEQAEKYRQAQQAVNRVLRHRPRHGGARALHARLTGRKRQREQKRRRERQERARQIATQPFEPLKVPPFLERLDLETEVATVVAYLERRYWKERDRRGKKQTISYRTVMLVVVVQGIKDWTLAHLYRKLKEPREESLRLALGFGADADNLPTYQALAQRIRQMGVFPLKYLTRKLSRRAVERGYVQLDEVLLDTSLIAACCDLFRFDPTSPTGYTEHGAAWSYPKYGRRVFGFKLALVTNGRGDILDVAVSPANVDDISLGKQAVQRLAQTLAGLTIRHLLADSGYCSKSLRQLAIEKLGAMPLIAFNPRNGAQKDKRFTYLDDQQDWLVRKREIRQAVERTFAYLKQHYGLKNLHVRGLAAVSRYLIGRCLGAIAVSLVAQQMGRPDLKARPSEVLYTY
jgi:tetratricopeptide (TPR) repeat protein/transposase